MENRIKNIILLQLIVVIYTINSIIAKFATGAEVFSVKFFFYYAMEICVLGVYAICWQQMIKRFELSVAYANRSMAILWTALWSVLIFREALSIKQIIGILLVVVGTIIVNTPKKDKVNTDISEDRHSEEVNS